MDTVNEILECGAAKRVITPPADLLGGVRGLMGKKFAAVADDICVRVMALKFNDKIWLLCGFDLDKAPNPADYMNAITQNFGIPEEYITFYGIHTHTAPVLGKRDRENMNNVRSMGEDISNTTDRYEEYVESKLLEAVKEALGNLVPARIRFGKEPCGCNVNRCMDFYDIDEDGSLVHTISEGPNPLAPADHNVYVLIAEDLQGVPISFLINYAMHNTVMFMNKVDKEGNCAISSDVGGNVSRLVEEHFPGTVALWCSGAAGDMAPLRPYPRFNIEPGEEVYQYEYRQKLTILKQMYSNHYAAVIEAIDNASDPLKVTSIKACVTWISTPGRTVIKEGRGPQQKVQIITGGDQPDYSIRVHYVLLGDLFIVGIGGELYSSYALKLQEQFPQYKVLVINHDASLIKDAGYILDDATWDRVAQIPIKDCRLPGTPPAFEKGFVENALLETTEAVLENFTGNGTNG